MKATEKLIGKKVIIRSYGAGVFFGTLNEAEPTGDKLTVELLNSRRIWRWEGACSISQIAEDGTKDPENCKFTKFVDQQIISSVIEIIPASEKAINIIENVKVWER